MALRYLLLSLALITLFFCINYQINTPQRITNPPKTFGLHTVPKSENLLSASAQSFYRVPPNVISTFPKDMIGTSKKATGIRWRFQTNASSFIFCATVENGTLLKNWGITGERAVDILINNTLIKTVLPNSKGQLHAQIPVNSSSDVIDIFFPLNSIIDKPNLILESGKFLSTSTPKKCIVWYGSSITAGAFAESPSKQYTAQLAQMTNTDFINLGFSGTGRGEKVVMDFVAKSKADLFILDYWANPKVNMFKNNFIQSIKIIRKMHPKTPILITTPFYTKGRELEHQQKFDIIKNGVQLLKTEGYKKLFIHNQMKLTIPLPDNRHPNQIGIDKIAENMLPTISKLIK